MKKTLRERFEEKYVVNEETGCWEWTGYLRPHGYGYISIGGHILDAELETIRAIAQGAKS